MLPQFVVRGWLANRGRRGKGSKMRGGLFHRRWFELGSVNVSSLFCRSINYCSSRSIVSGRSRVGWIEVYIGTCDVRVAAVEHVASTDQPILRFLLPWIVAPVRTGSCCSWSPGSKRFDSGCCVEVLCSTWGLPTRCSDSLCSWIPSVWRSRPTRKSWSKLEE